MSTEFWVTLSASKYDVDLGWDCAVLTIPGAKLVELRMLGFTVPGEQIKVDMHRVRFVNRPADGLGDATAKIRLEKRLLTVDNAIVVALIAMMGTLGSAYLAYLGATQKGETKRAELDLPVVAASKTPPPSSGSPALESSPPTEQSSIGRAPKLVRPEKKPIAQISQAKAAASPKANPSQPMETRPEVDASSRVYSDRELESLKPVIGTDVSGSMCRILSSDKFIISCNYSSFKSCQEDNSIFETSQTSCIPKPDSFYCHAYITMPEISMSESTLCYNSRQGCDSSRSRYVTRADSGFVGRTCKQLPARPGAR